MIKKYEEKKRVKKRKREKRRMREKYTQKNTERDTLRHVGQNIDLTDKKKGLLYIPGGWIQKEF